MLTSAPLQVNLRPYQADALQRIAAAEARGVRKQLGVAATGLGKTIIFCALAQQRGGRTLILAHRDELVSQAVHKVREVWPGVDAGIVKAGENNVHAQVVVASVQTLARERRLGQLIDAYEVENLSYVAPTEPFDLIVVDEAHHTAADTYRRILDGLEAGTTDGPLLLGVTATPDRGDGKGLDDLFDEITWNYDILWGIRAGFLCDVRGQHVKIDTLDLSRVKVRRGDYDAGQAGRALEDADAPQAIAEAWVRYAKGRRTLVFTPTVATAQLTADALRQRGVRSGFVHGGTPLDERRQLLRDYSAGTVEVIVNCAVLTEGFDEPRTDCIVVARPTQSRALFTQMVGRGTRKHPDKTDLLVLDVVGASEQHSLVTIPSLFGLEREFAGHMGDGSGALTDVINAQEQHLVRIGRMRAEDAELFRKVREQGITWIKVHTVGQPARYERTLSYHDGTQRVPLPTVVLTHRHPDREDGWLCGLIDVDGKKRVLIADVELTLAQGVGEDWARKTMHQHGGSTRLIEADAQWRKGKPSPKSKAFATRLGLNPKEYRTAGDLSDAIDGALLTKQRGRRRPA